MICRMEFAAQKRRHMGITPGTSQGHILTVLHLDVDFKIV